MSGPKTRSCYQLFYDFTLTTATFKSASSSAGLRITTRTSELDPPSGCNPPKSLFSRPHFSIKCQRIVHFKFTVSFPSKYRLSHLCSQFFFIVANTDEFIHYVPVALVLNVPNWQRTEVSISSKPVFINNSIITALLSPCSAMDKRSHNIEQFPNEEPKKCKGSEI